MQEEELFLPHALLALMDGLALSEQGQRRSEWGWDMNERWEREQEKREGKLWLIGKINLKN